VPRGKYPRQPAAVLAAQRAHQPAPAIVAAPAVPVVVADAVPPPTIDPALLADAAQVVQQAAQVAEVAITNARRPHRFADHAKSRDIDSLPIAELRAYAREIGMSRRDAEELAEGRLRAGCKSHLAHHFDDLTE
jgi:hypothetical protein